MLHVWARLESTWPIAHELLLQRETRMAINMRTGTEQKTTAKTSALSESQWATAVCPRIQSSRRSIGKWVWHSGTPKAGRYELPTPQSEWKDCDFYLLHLDSHLYLQRCSVDLREEKPGTEKERGEEAVKKGRSVKVGHTCIIFPILKIGS